MARRARIKQEQVRRTALAATQHRTWGMKSKRQGTDDKTFDQRRRIICARYHQWSDLYDETLDHCSIVSELSYEQNDKHDELVV